MRISLLSAVALLLFTLPSPLASAQDDDALPETLRRQFESLVGDWEMKGTVDEGDAVASLSLRWAPGKHMLVFNATWSDPERDSIGSGSIGWDAIEKKVHMTEFWDNGTYHHRLFNIESDKLWKGEEYAGGDEEGKEVRGTMQIELHGPDKWTFHSSDSTVGGEPQDPAHLVAHRATGEHKSKKSSPEEFKEFGERLEGRWMGDITLIADWPGEEKKQGDKITGYTTYRWIADGKGLEWENVSGTTTGKSIATYDAGSKHIRMFHVGSGGMYWQSVIWKKSDQEWRWKIIKSSLVDGRELTGDGSWVLEENGNKHIIQGNAQLDGNDLPKLRDVYTRVDHFSN